MRITKLWIKEYKNLKDFTWQLNPSSPVAVIVGKNASGKSNLLEAIIHILSAIKRKKDKSPDFEYTLEYNIGQKNEDLIKIDTSNNQFQVLVNNEKVNKLSSILPSKVYCYYSGITNRMEEIIKSYRNELVEYFTIDMYDTVLIALLSSVLERIKIDFLLKEFGISGLDEISFSLQKPFKKQRGHLYEPSLANLWNAPEALFLLFYELAINTISSNNINEYDESITQIDINLGGNDFMNVINKLRLFEKDVFDIFKTGITLGYIRNLQFSLKKENSSEPILFNDLSEGEKQRLAVKGLLEIHQGQEILFLLDEPDAFAHPRWQWDFIPDIQKAIGDNTFQQVLFVTHSPIVLSTVKDNAFFMENGIINPLKNVYGQDANMSLLKMDAERYRASNPQKDFEEYFNLINRGEGETEDALNVRKELASKYGNEHPELERADLLIKFFK